jgi:hypothetical protein
MTSKATESDAGDRGSVGRELDLDEVSLNVVTEPRSGGSARR